ncbi:alanine--tRNA ligase [Patescibacteria group bacterium]
MKSSEILEKYIEFFKQKGHIQIPNVSLVPENDPTLLYVNSGMFPLVPYLSGAAHPAGQRVVNVQRCLRFAEDLDLVGDNVHTVAFHMLGNWSLGDYFKAEQLPWLYEFLVKVLGLDINKIYASVFVGDESAPKDEESIEIIKRLFKKYGVEAEEGTRIFSYGKKENWWQRGDAVGELGGPDSEVFYYLGEGKGDGKDPAEHQDEFLEIGNSVFMQYVKTEEGWGELPQKNVDFGGGLERMAMVVQGKNDIYLTDNFYPIIQKLEELSKTKYTGQKEMRVIADHMRAATFLAMDGVLPSNKDQGYILRRLIRLMVRAGRKLGLEKDISVSLVPVVVNSFKWIYPDLVSKKEGIEESFKDEEGKFGDTLRRASNEFGKNKENIIAQSSEKNVEGVSEEAFNLYQSLGYPFEMFLDDLRDSGVVDEEFLRDMSEVFKKRYEEHQIKSRAGAEGKFKGGLADNSEEVLKYHTATHLLLHALREVLGDQIQQHGSNITGERLRFDFNYQEKLTEGQILEIEGIINDAIKKALPVKFAIMEKQEALETGALHAFNEKYGDSVKVYYIGDDFSSAISKEFCGGPHVENTSQISPVEIFKQKNIGKGMLRVYLRSK